MREIKIRSQNFTKEEAREAWNKRPKQEHHSVDYENLPREPKQEEPKELKLINNFSEYKILDKAFKSLDKIFKEKPELIKRFDPKLKAQIEKLIEGVNIGE